VWHKNHNIIYNIGKISYQITRYRHDILFSFHQILYFKRQFSTRNSYYEFLCNLYAIATLSKSTLTRQPKPLCRHVCLVHNVFNIIYANVTIWHLSARLIYNNCRDAETPSIRPKYLVRPIIHAPTIAIRGIRRPWEILTSIISSPSGGERTRWEKFFLVRHSQRVTFFFSIRFADKSETSGLGECLRFPAA